MESTQENLRKVPLENIVVGHQGMYDASIQDDVKDIDEIHSDIVSVTKNISDVMTVIPDIPTGRENYGKVILSIEDGIKSFVKDELAKKDNHLPNTQTGVWVYYLTKGIEKDFGRTWNKEPVSIKEKQSSYEKSAEKGKRILSKKEKNELLAKCDINFYSDDIKSGRITIEDAQMQIAEAFSRKLDLENAGYILSSKKTEGILKFDEIEEIAKNWDGQKGYDALYKLNDLKIVVPNLQEYIEKRGNNSYETQLKKITFIPKFYLISDSEELISEISKHIKEEINGFTIKGVHLVKRTIMGHMKPRYILVDLQENKSHKQKIVLIEQAKQMIRELMPEDGLIVNGKHTYEKK